MGSVLRLFTCAVVMGSVSLVWGQSGERIALVVGNSSYPKAPLLNPRNDAQAMTKLLREAGFTVDQQIDTSQTQLSQAAARFGKAIKDPKVKFGLFYYAGHGLQQEWRNYLVPVSADIRTAEDIKKKTVDVSELLAYMEEAKGRSFLVILDACRDDPFAGNYKPSARGLSQFDAPVGSMLAFATSPGNVAMDGEGENGLYTSNLLREFAVRGARLEDAFKRVRLGVRLASNGRQIPWESTSLEEDVYLFPNERKILTDAEHDKLLDREIASWLTVKSSNDHVQLGNFIREFPSGSASELAQARLNRLLAAQAQQEALRVGAAAAAAEASREAQARVDAARREAEKAEAQRIAAEQAERARLQAAALAAAKQEAERQEAIRIAAEQAEVARLAEQKQRETQIRLAKLEAERLAAARALQEEEQTRATLQRQAAARIEVERIAAERIQAERLAAAKAEETQRAQAQATQLADQQRQEAVKAARLDAEKRATAASTQALQEAEQARLQAQRVASAQADAARIAQERNDAQRVATAQAEDVLRAQRQAQEAATRARIADEQRLEQARLETSKVEQARLAMARLEAEKSQATARLAVETVAAATRVQLPAAAEATSFAVTPYFKGYQEHQRTYQVGDTYGYQVIDQFTKLSKPLTMQVTAVDVNADRVEYNNGEYATDTMGNTIVNPRGGFSTPRQFYPAELYVGKKWQTIFKQSRPGGVVYTFRYDVKVVARETITVPGGTFDTFKLEARGYNIQLGARLERNIWVAPGVSGDIAHETLVRLRSGTIEQNDRQELLSIKRTTLQTANR